MLLCQFFPFRLLIRVRGIPTPVTGMHHPLPMDENLPSIIITFWKTELFGLLISANFRVVNWHDPCANGNSQRAENEIYRVYKGLQSPPDRCIHRRFVKYPRKESHLHNAWLMLRRLLHG